MEKNIFESSTNNIQQQNAEIISSDEIYSDTTIISAEFCRKKLKMWTIIYSMISNDWTVEMLSEKDFKFTKIQPPSSSP